MCPQLLHCWHGNTQNGLAEEVEGWSEAKRWQAVTGAEWASRRSEAEGLDRSATLGAEKRQARGGGIGVYRACRFGAEC